MPNAPTTHLLEIEPGTAQAEPLQFPLALGEELSTTSIGRRGMWRVEGQGVLDVHAFLYFDGQSLFLQSASDETSAMVDGYRVGKGWTELHPPCRIELGAARIRFRSLLGEAQSAAFDSVGHSRPAPTPGPPPPGASARPHVPGSLAFGDADESTRILPLDTSSGRPSGPSLPGGAPVPAPRPAAGRPVEEEVHAQPSGYPSGMPGPPGMMPPHGYGYPGQQPFASGPGMPPQGAGGTGPYAHMGPMGPYGAPPGHESTKVTRGGKASVFQDPSKRKMLLAFGVILLGGAYVLLMDDEPAPAPKRGGAITVVDAGAGGAKVGGGDAGQAPVAVEPSTVSDAGATAAPVATQASAPVAAPTPAPASKSGKSLERQAIDLVAAGQYAAAIPLYQQLIEQSPENQAYRDALRILRARVDAGAR